MVFYLEVMESSQSLGIRVLNLPLRYPANNLKLSHTPLHRSFNSSSILSACRRATPSRERCDERVYQEDAPLRRPTSREEATMKKERGGLELFNSIRIGLGALLLALGCAGNIDGGRESLAPVIGADDPRAI